MNKSSSFENQRGAVLIVALVLLLVLTVLGTASIRDTTMEERMAGNFRDHAAALEAAETALRIGEAALSDATTHAAMDFNGSDGTYEVTLASLSLDPFTASHFDELLAPDEALTYDDKLLVSAVPRYYIEKLPETVIGNSDLAIGTQNQPPKVHYYRVTGKGFGTSKQLDTDGNPVTAVILQSTYFTWNGND
jgi:type IV pilus assembly protein PilX